MSMWSKLKYAVLTTAATVAIFQFPGLNCLGLPGYDTILKYVMIGSIFD